MKLLITGGAGFIGTNFIYYMQKQYPQDKLICLDKLTYAGRRENLDDALAAGNMRFEQGDIGNEEQMDRLFAREHFDAVINFAAETHVDRSIISPTVFVTTNVTGTQVLLEACRKHGTARYHQVSTDEVYGDLPLDRPDLFFTETTPLHTSSPYSASKAAADLLCLAYQRTYGLFVTVSRCSNNYGPFQFPEKLIPLMLHRALCDKPLPVYGQGLQIRDWLYVEDHCRALDMILRSGKSGEVYNVGGHNELRNLDVVRLILQAVDKPESLIAYVADRAGHDQRYAIDPAKIGRELGWEPQTSFSEGLQSTIAWYLQNPDFLAQTGGIKV